MKNYRNFTLEAQVSDMSLSLIPKRHLVSSENFDPLLTVSISYLASGK